MFNPYMPIAQSVKLANDEAKRQLLIDKANYEASLISSQTILGPDMLPYITPFADKLITNDTHKTLSDDRNVKIQMETLLNNVSDKEIADYILNKLTIDDMKILIPNWNELLIKLKKTNKKFTKDTFYNWIMLFLKDYTNTVTTIPETIPTNIIPAPIGMPKPQEDKTELLKKDEIRKNKFLEHLKKEEEKVKKEKHDGFKTELSRELLSRNPEDKLFWLDHIENNRIKADERLIADINENERKATLEEQKRQIKEENLMNKEDVLAHRKIEAQKNEQRLMNNEDILGNYYREKEKQKIQQDAEKGIMAMEDTRRIIRNERRDEKRIINSLPAKEFIPYVKEKYNIILIKPKKGDGGIEVLKKDFIKNTLADEIKKKHPEDKTKFIKPIETPVKPIETPVKPIETPVKPTETQVKPKTWSELFGINKPSKVIDTGKGIIKITLRKPMAKRVITGKGLILEKPPIVRYLQINDVHKIDMQKLNQEIPLLHCLYVAQTSKPLSKLSNVHISKDTVEVIKNMLNNKFNQKEYSLLPLEERRIIQQFNKQCKFNLNIPDKDNDKAIEDFNIMYGEFKSGNNNKDLLIKLKKQVILFMNEKLITQKDGQSILLQIALS